MVTGEKLERLPNDFLTFMIDHAEFWTYHRLDEETICIHAPDREAFNTTYWDAGCVNPKWDLTYQPLLVQAVVDALNLKGGHEIECLAESCTLFDKGGFGVKTFKLDAEAKILCMGDARLAAVKHLYEITK